MSPRSGNPTNRPDSTAQPHATDAIDTVSDPVSMEAIGRALGDVLERFEPTALLIWEIPYDLVLGHVVGRELGVRVVRCYDRDGLVGFSGQFPDEGRLALVVDEFRGEETVRAMCALAVQQHQDVVVAGAITCNPGPGTDELRRQDVELVCLESLAGQPDVTDA